MSLLSDLQVWYASNCDDEWEHSFGIKIGSLDNPGWSVAIDLIGTNLQEKPFAIVSRETDDESWLHCWVTDGTFHGAGDPHQLDTILELFLTWAKSQNEDWLQPPTGT